MKNVFKSIVAITVFAFSFSTNAQTPKNENSVLWEVSGNGLTKPSYLFGTVHMICGKDYVMQPKAVAAFSKTSKLALEINVADPNEIALVQQMAIGKEPLSKKLTAKQIAQLEEVLQKSGGFTLAQVDSYTLETVMSLLFMKSFGCTDLKFYEMEFVSKAKESSKPVVGLEKAIEQVEMLCKSFTDDEMISYLQQINPDMCTEMIKDYVSEDINSLYKMTTSNKVMSANTKKILLDNRNENWSKIMPVMMQKESVFFAVGAAHLAGELGIVNLLKKAGYTVKSIMN
ncbi:TraB/GumN family protein [Flavobacterium aestivum]|uniref:TraB/GumN family protein n=1 Tax=Flavobacterium aestivum TaxID=3003257 RepID=UPI002482CC0D|nr:TraB/GumN family protein [Flavobacterium aestivum]